MTSDNRDLTGKTVWVTGSSRGIGRVVFNLILVVALVVATVGSVIGLNERVIKPIREMFEKPAEQDSADPATILPVPTERPAK